MILAVDLFEAASIHMGVDLRRHVTLALVQEAEFFVGSRSP
jgi:hypothetical protein